MAEKSATKATTMPTYKLNANCLFRITKNLTRTRIEQPIGTMENCCNCCEQKTISRF